MLCWGNCRCELMRAGEPLIIGAIRLDGHYDSVGTADQGASEGVWRLRRKDLGSEPCTASKRACTCISAPRPSARRWRASTSRTGCAGACCGPAYVPRPKSSRGAAAVVETPRSHRGPSIGCRVGHHGAALGAPRRPRHGGHSRGVPADRGDAVVAPVERPDFPRHHHAMAHRSDRRKLWQPISRRGRRHGAGARRAWSRRHAHPRHHGARPRRNDDRQRTQGRGRPLQREPVRRQSPRRTDQSRRRRARGPGRIRRQGLGFHRLGAAAPDDDARFGVDAPAGGAGRGPPARRRQAQHAGELRRLARLARQPGRARPRRRRSHRNRPQERQPGRRRPAQRPSVEVREYPSEPHPPACRRTRFQARLGGCVAPVDGPGRGEAGRRRRARGDARRAQHLAARPPAGASGRCRADGSRRVDFGDLAGRVCRRRNPADRRRPDADGEGRDHRSQQSGVRGFRSTARR